MTNNILTQTTTLRQALVSLNALSGHGVMTLLVVDDEGRLAGTLTDGDVRRALLGGAALESSVVHAMCAHCTALTRPLNPEEVRAARLRGIKLIPIVDGEHRVVGALNLSRQINCLPIRAVLMAGGRGERLRPLTDSTPKPLLKVGPKPIIDYNIEALRRCGVGDITVTTRYLAEQLEAHFEGSEVKCVREDQPLGTIGSLGLIPSSPLPTLLMNSDLLTNVSFEEMYLHHVGGHYDITIATVPHTVSIPFAILTTDGDRVTALEEKPTYTHYANAGIYLIESRMLAGLKPERLDAPDFIEAAIANGARVGHFPISGVWLDIGSPADFKQASEIMKISTPWQNQTL